MKKLVLIFSGLFLAALASSGLAYADTISFNFAGTSGNSPSSNQFSGSGQFTISEQSSGVYLITGISGFVNEGSNVGSGESGVAISSLILPGDFSSSGHSTTNDNLLYVPVNSNGNYFDKFGLAFILQDGSQIILYNNDGFDTWIAKSSNKSVSEGIKTFTVGDITADPSSTSPVPEPGSFALLGTGVLGLAGVVRRKLSV